MKYYILDETAYLYVDMLIESNKNILKIHCISAYIYFKVNEQETYEK